MSVSNHVLTERVFLVQGWQAWLVLEPIIPVSQLLLVSVFPLQSSPPPYLFSSWSGVLDHIALAV